MNRVLRTMMLLLFFVSVQYGQGKDESDIRQAALDYIEGWYEANAARMERALHPELAKRIVNRDQTSHMITLNHIAT